MRTGVSICGLSAAETAVIAGMLISASCARMEVWTVIEFTADARARIREAFLALIPTLSDEALWHIAVVLLDEERIMDQGGKHE